MTRYRLPEAVGDIGTLAVADGELQTIVGEFRAAASFQKHELERRAGVGLVLFGLLYAFFMAWNALMAWTFAEWLVGKTHPAAFLASVAAGVVGIALVVGFERQFGPLATAWTRPTWSSVPTAVYVGPFVWVLIALAVAVLEGVTGFEIWGLFFLASVVVPLYAALGIRHRDRAYLCLAAFFLVGNILVAVSPLPEDVASVSTSALLFVTLVVTGAVRLVRSRRGVR